jgi:hypothetical protein
MTLPCVTICEQASMAPNSRAAGGLYGRTWTLPLLIRFRRRPTFRPLLALSLLVGASSAIAAGSDTAAPVETAIPPSTAAPQASCPHPYFPLEEGLRLTYRAGRSELSLATREIKTTPEGLTGTLAVDMKGKTGSTEATCSADGVRTGVGGLEGSLLSASGMDVEVVSAEGVVVPAPTAMVPGGSWKNSLSVKLRPPESASLPGGIRPVLASTFDKEATIVGEEEVTVAAGTFKALKVRNVTTARAGRATALSRSLESYIWFAPGVGIVKVATGDKTDLELLKVERPTPPQAEPRPEKAKKPSGTRKH